MLATQEDLGVLYGFQLYSLAFQSVACTTSTLESRRMTGCGSYSNYILFKIALLMMCHFFNGCNSQTFESLSQNFCLNLGTSGIEDNLSCPDVAEQTGTCFPRGALCDGVQNCSSGIDEGDTLATLACGEYFYYQPIRLQY